MLMTKSEFRKLGAKVIDSIYHELRLNNSKLLTFEEDADYDSGRIGNFYISASQFTLCVQVFINYDVPNYICTTAIFQLPEDFLQLYPELNEANDELCGVKVTYNEEFNGLALICEIDTRNIENNNYGKFVLNGVSTIFQNMTIVIEKNLLKGVIAAIREL